MKFFELISNRKYIKSLDPSQQQKVGKTALQSDDIIIINHQIQYQ